MTDSGHTLRLLHEALSGSDGAFEQLLAHNRPKLNAFVRRRLNPRLVRRVGASDIVQEAQLEALARKDDYLRRQPMPFSLWLLKTAHERLRKVEREHLQTAKRAIDRELPLPDESSLLLAHRFAGTGTSPSAQVNREEVASRVRMALGRLSEISREILLLRNFEGLTNNEASLLLEIPAETAKKRYTRAVLQMQRLLESEGYTESTL